MDRAPWLLAAIALVATGSVACSGGDGDGVNGTTMENPFVQPGLDDPTARPWAYAGDWYTADRYKLDAEIEGYINGAHADEQHVADGILVPHPGLKYQGPVAGQAWSRIVAPDIAIVIAPNHFVTEAEPFAIWDGGPWLVPGHALEIADDIVAEIIEAQPDITTDPEPFQNYEVEMQLIWLQYMNPDVKIVPISIRDNLNIHFLNWDVERIEGFADVLSELMQRHIDAGENIMIVATTDITHHEPIEDVRAKDEIFLEYVDEYDIEGLYDYVVDAKPTICGEIPSAVMMATMRKLGHPVPDYRGTGTSADINGGDKGVGYPAIVSWR